MEGDWRVLPVTDLPKRVDFRHSEDTYEKLALLANAEPV